MFRSHLLFLLIAIFPSTALSQLKLVTSVPPYAWVLRELTLDKSVVKNILGAQEDPHLFELSVDDMSAIEAADLVVLNGRGLEPWAEQLSVTYSKKILKVGDDRSLMVKEVDCYLNCDSYLWLNPRQMLLVIDLVVDRLCTVEPSRCAAFKSNAERLKTQIAEIDEQIELALKPFSGVSFVSYHQSWLHFGKRYNLTQASIIKKSDSYEPAVRDYAQLHQLVQTGKLRLALVGNAAEMEALNNSMGGSLKCVEVDTFGFTNNYIEMMKLNLKKIVKALS